MSRIAFGLANFDYAPLAAKSDSVLLALIPRYLAPRTSSASFAGARLHALVSTIQPKRELGKRRRLFAELSADTRFIGHSNHRPRPRNEGAVPSALFELRRPDCIRLLGFW